eukprot:m.1622814 g.1622814  ORF g.1622814 m.1622814 type:complete len:82 (-) comp25384_c1_seq55:121-366(-)
MTKRPKCRRHLYVVFADRLTIEWHLSANVCTLRLRDVGHGVLNAIEQLCPLKHHRTALHAVQSSCTHETTFAQRSHNVSTT